MREPIIRIEHLKKQFGQEIPIRDLSSNIYKGDVISVIGPSGTGKSTLIRCINLLERPTSGKIYIGDDEITAPNADVTSIRKRMGMVFQGFNLFPHMSVVENVMVGPIDQLGMSKQEAYETAMDKLRIVGVDSKAYNYPDELSGGQKQRVAIARALAMNPEIILLDEPTSALDPTRVGEVMSVIYTLAKKGMTMIIVTHDMNMARNVANRVFYLDGGRIYEEGTPEDIFDNPKGERTKKFMFQQYETSFVIDFHTFDYYEVIGQIEMLCKNNRVSSKLQNRVEFVLEELITNIILPKLSMIETSLSEVRFSVYCVGNDKIVVDFKHDALLGDLAGSGDDLTLKIIESMITESEKTEKNGMVNWRMTIE